MSSPVQPRRADALKLKAQPIVKTVRGASAVDRPARFVTRQVRGNQDALAYSLRKHSAQVVVRHGTLDIDMLAEIFGPSESYRLPASVTALPATPTVLDLGGNIGLFALYARTAWKAGSVDSFEPDPTNYALLKRAHGASREPGWTINPVAVSNRSDTLRFTVGHAANSRQSSEDEAGVDVPAVDIFERNHHVDVAKIDIEGGEWSILTDERFRTFGANRIVMEWHQHLCPEPDAHATVLRLLAEAGYLIRVDEVGPHRNGFIWAERV